MPPLSYYRIRLKGNAVKSGCSRITGSCKLYRNSWSYNNKIMLLAEGIVGHGTMVLYCIYRIAILGIQARVSRVYVLL